VPKEKIDRVEVFCALVITIKKLLHLALHCIPKVLRSGSVGNFVRFSLTATVAGDTTHVRAHAVPHKGGTALVLFNLNEATSEPITVTLS
jgi:hypothetical protein